MTQQFINTAKRVTGKKEYMRQSQYGYNHVAEYLIMYGSFFQRLVSQVGTYLLTGKFHGQHAGIYKCEGGCNIVGVGDLVLSDNCCYFDCHGRKEKEENEMADLITELVLAFDPMNPIGSLIKRAIEYTECGEEPLERALQQGGGLFAGDALSDFFKRNPFDTSRVVPVEYERWARINVFGQPEKDVDEALEYDRKSHELLAAMQTKVLENKANDRWLTPMCCSPRKMKDGHWAFWINTGTSTRIDGWKTEEQIREFLAGDGRLERAKENG